MACSAPAGGRTLSIEQYSEASPAPQAAETAESASSRADADGAIARFREAHGDFFETAVPFAPIRVEARWVPDASVKGEPGEFDIEELTLDATVPLPISRDRFLVLGALAGTRNMPFRQTTQLADERLHRYGLRLGYGAFLDDDLVVQAYWQPSIYSDLDGALSSKDLRLDYGTGLAVWRAAEGLFWKVGLAGTDAVDTGVIPVGGVTWHFAEGWRLDALLPRNLGVSYTPAPEWILSAGLHLESDEYHIRGPRALGKPEQDVHVQELTLELGVEHRFNPNLSLWARAGTTIAGNYDWSYGVGPGDYDGMLERALTLELGVGWRL